MFLSYTQKKYSKAKVKIHTFPSGKSKAECYLMNNSDGVSYRANQFKTADEFQNHAKHEWLLKGIIFTQANIT